MTRFLIALSAAATTVLLPFAMANPARAQTPTIIEHTQDGKPILLASVTVTASALPR